MICDGAGWHKSGDLIVPQNIVLLPLPPDTPELNRMENVREYLRGNKVSTRVWKNDAAIQQACKDAWNRLIADSDRIRSLGSCE